MRTLWRAVRLEPRAAGAAPVGRADRALAAGYALVALAEGLLRPDLTWRPAVTVLALVLAPALLWRRTHPLAATGAAWGAAGLLSVLQLVGGAGEPGLTAMLAVLVPLYALVRWGSGGEVVVGLGVVTAAVALGLVAAPATGAEAFGGVVLVLAVATLGGVFRVRADLLRRERTEIRNAERTALARELHDTVAHHVSAIAVQAQAGRAVAGIAPERAVEALGAIEAEASRTLSEMRAMVRLLREDQDAPYAPQRGTADLPGLARSDAEPAVRVHVSGPLDGLAPAVDAALYRLAQESVTNAVRHARGATSVVVDVRRAGAQVQLRVHDDGRSVAGPFAGSGGAGFGLRGMAERADLLGGSFRAGPAPDGGWLVEAVLPAHAAPGTPA